MERQRSYRGGVRRIRRGSTRHRGSTRGRYSFCAEPSGNPLTRDCSTYAGATQNSLTCPSVPPRNTRGGGSYKTRPEGGSELHVDVPLSAHGHHLDQQPSHDHNLIGQDSDFRPVFKSMFRFCAGSRSTLKLWLMNPLHRTPFLNDFEAFLNQALRQLLERQGYKFETTPQSACNILNLYLAMGMPQVELVRLLIRISEGEKKGVRCLLGFRPHREVIDLTLLLLTLLLRCWSSCRRIRLSRMVYDGMNEELQHRRSTLDWYVIESLTDEQSCNLREDGVFSGSSVALLRDKRTKVRIWIVLQTMLQQLHALDTIQRSLLIGILFKLDSCRWIPEQHCSRIRILEFLLNADARHVLGWRNHFPGNLPQAITRELSKWATKNRRNTSELQEEYLVSFADSLGLNKPTIEALVSAFIGVNDSCEKLFETRALLFGSAASGCAIISSDADILVLQSESSIAYCHRMLRKECLELNPWANRHEIIREVVTSVDSIASEGNQIEDHTSNRKHSDVDCREDGLQESDASDADQVESSTDTEKKNDVAHDISETAEARDRDRREANCTKPSVRNAHPWRTTVSVRMAAVYGCRRLVRRVYRQLLCMGPLVCYRPVYQQRKHKSKDETWRTFNCIETATIPILKLHWPVFRSPNPSGAESCPECTNDDISHVGRMEKGGSNRVDRQLSGYGDMFNSEFLARTRGRKNGNGRGGFVADGAKRLLPETAQQINIVHQMRRRGKRFPFFASRLPKTFMEDSISGRMVGVAAAISSQGSSVTSENDSLAQDFLDAYVSDSAAEPFLRSYSRRALADASTNSRWCDHYHVSLLSKTKDVCTRSDSQQAGYVDEMDTYATHTQDGRIVQAVVRWIEVDISFSHEVVIHNTRLLRSYSMSFGEQVQRFLRLVKFWAKRRCLTNARDGYLSSYSWTLLAIHFLQHCFFNNSANRGSKDVLPSSFSQGTWGQADSLALSLRERSWLPILPNLQLSDFQHEAKVRIGQTVDASFVDPTFGNNRHLPGSTECCGDSVEECALLKCCVHANHSSPRGSSSVANDKDVNYQRMDSSGNGRGTTRVIPVQLLWPEEDAALSVEEYARYLIGCSGTKGALNYSVRAKPAHWHSVRRLREETKRLFTTSWNRYELKHRGREALRSLVNNFVAVEMPLKVSALLRAFFTFYASQFNSFEFLVDISASCLPPPTKVARFSGPPMSPAFDVGHRIQNYEFNFGDVFMHPRSPGWLQRRLFLTIQDPFERCHTLGTYYESDDGVAAEMLRAAFIVSGVLPEKERPCAVEKDLIFEELFDNLTLAEQQESTKKYIRLRQNLSRRLRACCIPRFPNYMFGLFLSHEINRNAESAVQ